MAELLSVGGPAYQITGPARRFYSDPESNRFVGETVRTSNGTANTQLDHSPIFCRMADGSGVYVSPAHLKRI